MKRLYAVFAFVLLLLSGVALVFCRNYTVYILVYIFAFLFITCWAVFTPSTVPSKVVQAGLYALILAAQILFSVFALRDRDGWVYALCRVVGVLAVPLPLLIHARFFPPAETNAPCPTTEEPGALPYAQLLRDKEAILTGIDKLRQTGDVLSRVELTEMLRNLPRHRAFSYVNHGTLTDAYFQKADATLDNGYVWLVVTKSRSLPSDVIGLFTNRAYNHVSLAFDEDLETIVSYNGGERAVPPGLNAELLETLAGRNGSAVLVYRLAATTAQKTAMLQKIREINREGSAYNLLGLVLKTSPRPNILFCSQFVYTLLELAGLAYFDKKAAQVIPSDFIELDYERTLTFVRRITLDHTDSGHA